MRNTIKSGLTIILIIYVLILSNLILFKHLSIPEILSRFTFSYDDYYWNKHNFIPFRTIIYYLFYLDINFNIRVDNLVGNIIGFSPFGILLPLLSKRFLNFKKVTMATFCISLTFELLQIIFKFGSFDVDDLILNTFGGILGYLPIKIIYLFINYKQRQQKNGLSDN